MLLPQWVVLIGFYLCYMAVSIMVSLGLNRKRLMNPDKLRNKTPGRRTSTTLTIIAFWIIPVLYYFTGLPVVTLHIFGWASYVVVVASLSVVIRRHRIGKSYNHRGIWIENGFESWRDQ